MRKLWHAATPLFIAAGVLLLDTTLTAVMMFNEPSRESVRVGGGEQLRYEELFEAEEWGLEEDRRRRAADEPEETNQGTTR